MSPASAMISASRGVTSSVAVLATGLASDFLPLFSGSGLVGPRRWSRASTRMFSSTVSLARTAGPESSEPPTE